MAQSIYKVTQLYNEALDFVTSSPGNWMGFLESAGRNFGYPFQDQLLINYQRPEATAVLTYDQWTNQFGRRIRRGSTGIGVFGRSGTKTTVKYYFDIADTFPTLESKPVPLWSMSADDFEPVRMMLHSRWQAAGVVAYGNQEMIEASDMPVTMEDLCALASHSLTYMLMYRMDMDNYDVFTVNDLDVLRMIDTPESINMLGRLVSMIGGNILSDIAHTVRSSVLEEPRFFAEPDEIVYDGAENKETNEPEKGGNDHGDDLYDAERTEPARPDAPGGAGGDGQIRDAPGELSEGAAALPVSEPADQRNPEPAPVGDPGERHSDDGESAAEVPGGGRADGGTESPEPPPLGGSDEQSEAQRGGDDSHRTGVRLIPDEPEQNIEPELGPSVEETPGPSAISAEPQMSIFEMEPIQTDEQLSFMPAPQYSQTVIDEALRIGANDRNSRLMIAAYFSKDKGIEANIAFLREHYGTNGAGFYHRNQQYAIWYDSDGIRLAPGNTVRSRMAMTISWETAASRIRELLDERRYMDAEELSNVREYELSTLSNEFALAARDMTQEARDAGFAPTILAAIPGVFPESADNIAALITDPESLQTVIEEWTAVVDAYEQGQDIFRFRVPARRFLERLRDMQIEPILFPADQNFRPDYRLFITEDEIENVLRGHSGDSEYRLGVYSFYRLNGDRKDREDYLKHLHGEYQGSYNGNNNLEYRTKGVMFAHGRIGNHTAEVNLSWNQAEKFVAAMISEERFLSDADRMAMPDYERKRLAMIIHTAFYDLPDGIEKPFTGNPIGDYWENVREIQTQLEDPDSTEKLYHMLQTVVNQTFPMERYHAERQKALADLTAYRNGTYSLFGEVKTPIVIEPVPESLEESDGNPDLDDDFMTFPCVIALQWIAYYSACQRGLNVDKPRNLAKVVTVE